MKDTPTLAASLASQKDLNSLLITAAGNPRGEALDGNGLTKTVAELLTRGAKRNDLPFQPQSFTKNPKRNKIG